MLGSGKSERRATITDKNPGQLRSLQARVFVLTWFSYASYYLTRKNFGVAKTTLGAEYGIDSSVLGGIDTLYLGLYALGQFINGGLGDRVGARKMLGYGMIGTGVCAALFSTGSAAYLFGIAFGLNGLCQATGWPNNVKAMGPWFNRKQRGKVMGIWCTNYQVGGLVATALATYLIAHYSWQVAFQVPALWVSAMGACILLFLVERPRDVGLPPVEEEETVSVPSERAPFMAMLRIPALWALGGAYFGLKLIRYSLLFWLPYYLETALGYGQEDAGYMSTAFEAGGIVGTIGIGWLTDRYFPKNRSRLTVPVLLGLAVALWLYQYLGSTGAMANIGTLALVGFMLFGPDALISGAAAQDLGGTRATGSAAGIINGLGSIGGMASGIMLPFYERSGAWDMLFYTFVVLALISAAALMPLAIKGGPAR